MSPDQRAATVGAHIVTDLGELPDAFRERVLATGRRLAAERARAARERPSGAVSGYRRPSSTGSTNSCQKGRDGEGSPSSADFLLHDMPAVIDRLARAYEASTAALEDGFDVRVLITAGVLVDFMAVYVTLASDGDVEIIYLEAPSAGYGPIRCAVMCALDIESTTSFCSPRYVRRV